MVSNGDPGQNNKKDPPTRGDLESPIAMPKELVALKQRLNATSVRYALASEIVQRVNDLLVEILTRCHVGYVSRRETRGLGDASDVANTEFTIDTADLLHVSQSLVARRPVCVLHDKTGFD